MRLKLKKQILQTLYSPQKEIQQYQGRVMIIAGLVVFLLLCLIARLVYLQIFQHPHYFTLSKQNLLSVAPIEPGRGLIYDRKGVLLAGNFPVFSLEILPENTRNLSKALKELGQIIPLSEAEQEIFKKQMSQRRKFNPVTLKVKLSDKERAVFAVNQYRFPGFFIQAPMMRYYPFGALTAPVTGYVGRINAQELENVDMTNYSATNFIGKSGIEKYDEKLLHGTAGIQQIETSALGGIVRSFENRHASAGKNLYLTIDAALQTAVSQSLKNEVGGVVMLDPHNGEILALVSQPSFDPNLFVSGISRKAYKKMADNPDRPLFNRILQGEFPPGSTIKPFYALKALDMNSISPADKIFDPGFFKLPKRAHAYHDWFRPGHGWVNVESAIIQSCDVYFFHLAEKMGIAPMAEALKQFGLGQAVGIDTYIERKGLVPSPEWKKRVHHLSWFPGDTVISGIGQGYILTTPLQLAAALMRLVNQGEAFVPHLLLKTEQENMIAENMPFKLKPVKYSAAAWRLVLKSMREVVSDPRGTAYKSGRNALYTFGGKTGTAQVFSLKGQQKDKADLLPKKLRDHSWFVAFAPADQPKIVMVIFLEHGGEGKAATLVRPVLDSYFKLYPANNLSSD